MRDWGSNKTQMLKIIEAQSNHHDAIWEIFHTVVKSGDTYVYDPHTSQEEALKIWCGHQVKTYVALTEDRVVGTYILKPNFPGLGSHIANCSYMVSDQARGLGVGRAMAEHSLQMAKDAGYLGMQFNIVMSTNKSAIKLWESLRFKIIGTTPKAFQHKELGFVDTYIMYREL